MHDLALADHVHCVVATDYGEQQAANDESGLEDKDGCGVRFRFDRAAARESRTWRDDGFVKHAGGELGSSEVGHIWSRGIVS